MVDNSKLVSCYAYDPNLSKGRAKELVQASQIQGAFIIRPSESQKGDLVITAL